MVETVWVNTVVVIDYIPMPRDLLSQGTASTAGS